MKVTFESASDMEAEVIIKGQITDPEVEALLEFIKSRNASQTKKLMLYKEDEQFLVDVDEIVYIEVTCAKVETVTLTDRYDTKRKLYELKEMLSTSSFAQINKGTLVNIDFVKSVQAEFSGNYTLKLKNSKEILTISRKFFKEFKSKI
ncbi:MAG: LytTR family transcriptional regulator DNA-binding domain-containing protein [Ruminococcus sp.]|nr:LytTR family transcriptional regulator DNA-binding domain-containing protein [Ruminococcus sp.]